MFGQKHEKTEARGPLTETEIHGILSAIRGVGSSEDLLEKRLREAGLNPWATYVAAHGGSKRGIIAEIAATLELELPAAAKRREDLKAALQAPLSGIVDAGEAVEEHVVASGTPAVEQQVSECFKPIKL